MLRHVHALFQQRVDGDDALLRLAGLRFAQMGTAAEVYAHAGPSRACPAVRALPCALACRPPEPWHQRAAEAGPRRGEEFADRFAGRVAGLVVHDKREMAAQTDRLLAALRELNLACERPDGPLVFLEYAAGLDRGWFVEVAGAFKPLSESVAASTSATSA